MVDEKLNSFISQISFQKLDFSVNKVYKKYYKKRTCYLWHMKDYNQIEDQMTGHLLLFRI